MHHIYSVYVYLVFLILALFLSLLLVFIPSLQYRRKVARSTAKAIVFIAGIKLNIKGLQNLPKENCIVIANHSSYLDGLILYAALPPHFRFVIKREVTSVPFLHFLLRRVGSHFVERTNRKTAASHLKKLIRSAEQGDSLSIFPEGTFRVEAGLRPFQKGAFAVAYKTNLSIIPVFIYGARQALPAEEWKLKRIPLTVDIQSGVNNPSEFESVNELKDHFFAKFSEEVGNI